MGYTFSQDVQCRLSYKARVKNNGDLPRFYYEDTHPAIIDKNTWECVQLEFERQDEFIKEHRMNKYHQHSK